MRRSVVPETDLAEALQSVHDCMVFDPRDWAAGRRDAWLWAILVGWDPDEPGDTDDAMTEVAARYGWTDETVERLRRMQAAVAGVLAQRDREVRGITPGGLVRVALVPQIPPSPDVPLAFLVAREDT
jgi:hypothetical protein